MPSNALSSIKLSLKTYLFQQSYWLCVCVCVSVCVWSFAVWELKKIDHLIFLTYFFSCNGPWAPKERWHRREHNIISDRFRTSLTGTNGVYTCWRATIGLVTATKSLVDQKWCLRFVVQFAPIIAKSWRLIAIYCIAFELLLHLWYDVERTVS